jgi:hypothetical protein
MVDDAHVSEGTQESEDSNIIDVRVRLPGGLHTRDAIEGRQAVLGRSEPVDSATELHAEVHVPSLKGQAMARLRDAPPRNDDELRFETEVNFQIRDPSEAGAAAVALLLLENVRRQAGTRLNERPLREMLERLLHDLPAKDRVVIEREAYRTLEWIGRAIDPAMDEVKPTPKQDGQETHLDLIRRAIKDGFDLEMEYYTGARSELNRRRITPDSVEAERYLHAFCHSRQDVRVFRLSRIGKMWPVGGQAAAVRPPQQPRTSPGDGPQLSLLDADDN